MNGLYGMIGWGFIALLTVGTIVIVFYRYEKKLREVRHLASLASIDVDLTGLPNRDGFQKQLVEVVCSTRGKRARDVHGLLVCFCVFRVEAPNANALMKKFLLQRVAEALRVSARAGEPIGWLGNDRFGFVFVSQPPPYHDKMLERVKTMGEAVEGHVKSLRKGNGLSISIKDDFFILKKDEDAGRFFIRAIYS